MFVSYSLILRGHRVIGCGYHSACLLGTELIAAAQPKAAVAGVPELAGPVGVIGQEFLPFLLIGMHSVSVAVPLAVIDQGDHRFGLVAMPGTRLNYSDASMKISAVVALIG